MVFVSRRLSPAHARGARTDSPTLEARRSDGVRWMVAAAALSTLGATATALAIRNPGWQPVFIGGWVVLLLGVILFVRGFWQFVRS